MYASVVCTDKLQDASENHTWPPAHRAAGRHRSQNQVGPANRPPSFPGTLACEPQPARREHRPAGLCSVLCPKAARADSGSANRPLPRPLAQPSVPRAQPPPRLQPLGGGWQSLCPCHRAARFQPLRTRGSLRARQDSFHREDGPGVPSSWEALTPCPDPMCGRNSWRGTRPGVIRLTFKVVSQMISNPRISIRH